jgi:hypothetical protein
MVEASGQAGGVLEGVILEGINDFIDPPSVSGLCVLPDERRELARDISRRILESQLLGLGKIRFSEQE